MRRNALLVAGIGVTILLVGCGSNGGNRLSKAEFLQKGNAICKSGTRKINAAGLKAFASPGHPTQKETIAFAKQTVVPTVQNQLDQIRALKPPKDDEAQVKKILDLSQVAVDKVSANPALLGRETASEKANKLAAAYGLTACAG